MSKILCNARTCDATRFLSSSLSAEHSRFPQVYHNQPQIAYLVLKFVVTWVESQVAHLSPDGMAATLRFCLALLQVYSRNNMGKVGGR